MYYNTAQTQKLKPGLVTSYDIQPGNGGPILILALHKFVSYSLRHLLTAPGPTWGLTLIYNSNCTYISLQFKLRGTARHNNNNNNTNICNERSVS